MGPHPVILLLHGWTGDENAMWIFAARLPKDALLIAPRGLYTTPLGGYGWHPYKFNVWPWVDDFLPAIEQIREFISPENFPNGDFTKLSLVGFSQGAALSYAFFMSFPYLVNSVAGLSGFLPDGSEALARNEPLKDKAVFIAHGSKDELVPVSKARRAVEILNLAGAQVSYCEDEVGHKLSANCFQGLQTFFGKMVN
jgi:phospholipase/carboxylesterase